MDGIHNKHTLSVPQHKTYLVLVFMDDRRSCSRSSWNMHWAWSGASGWWWYWCWCWSRSWACLLRIDQRHLHELHQYVA